MLVRWVPSAKAATAAKVERCYTGGQACVAGWLRVGWRLCRMRVLKRISADLCTAWSLKAVECFRNHDYPCHKHAGPQDSQLVEHMRACNARGPLVIYICKLFPKHDCSRFDAFGRIMSGTVKPGDKVCGVVGCGFS